MNRVAKYNLILSWKEWIKPKPRTTALLISCRDRDWKSSLQSFRHIENKKRHHSDRQTMLFHAIFYIIEGIDELSKYTDYVWDNVDGGALGMMQLLGHRYRDEGDFDRMTESYLKSASRAQKLGDLKWGSSAYFYLANYAKSKLQAEEYICILLEKYATKISSDWGDLYKHKLHRPVVWLACHVQTPRGKAVLKKLPTGLALPSQTRQKVLLEHYADIKRDQDCFLGRNGRVVQGPSDLGQNRQDPIWGWLNWYKKEVDSHVKNTP